MLEFTTWIIGCAVALLLLIVNIIAVSGRDLRESDASFFDVVSAIVITIFVSLFSWFVVIFLVLADLTFLISMLYKKYVGRT